MFGKFRRGFSANALRWRIGSPQMRMLFFESLEFAKQPIVFGVGHLGGVQHVIRVVCAMQDFR